MLVKQSKAIEKDYEHMLIQDELGEKLIRFEMNQMHNNEFKAGCEVLNRKPC